VPPRRASRKSLLIRSRAAKLKQLEELRGRRRDLEATLESLKANDPEELARINKLAMEMKGHAVGGGVSAPARVETRAAPRRAPRQHPQARWTENLYAVKSWLVQKKNVAPYQVDELFKSCGLPKNLDVDD